MLGLLRFFLAICVFLSHSALPKSEINIGVVSVVIFYFISGYLMRRSYSRFILLSGSPIRSFLLDRVFKLFPQYVTVVVLSFVAMDVFGPSDHVIFMSQEFSWGKFISNMILIPANYVFEPLVLNVMMPHPVVPPAWSLSSEFHFYLLVPLLAVVPRTVFILLMLLVFGVEVSSFFFSSPGFNSENFGYRFIFGTLIFFLMGYCSSFNCNQLFWRWVLILFWGAYFVIFVYLAHAWMLFDKPFVKELLLGVVLAWPLTALAVGCKTKKASLKKIDDIVGQLSYPFFITHFLAFFVCEKVLGLYAFSQDGYLVAIVVVSFCMSFGLLFLQKRADDFRVKVRGFESMKKLNQ